ncbi:MAG: hypothetical protein FJX22_00325 [Alphaproteobacteria bacterium]|nr:hypothetical protein [Alphaproteobacteria bacterium]
MSDISDKPSLESAAATAGSGEQQPPAVEELANNDTPVTAFRPRRRATVNFVPPTDLQIDGGQDADSGSTVTESATDSAATDSAAADKPTIISAPKDAAPNDTPNPSPTPEAGKPAADVLTPSDPALASPNTPTPPDAAPIEPDLSRPADMPKKGDQPARMTGFATTSVATAPMLSVQLSDDPSANQAKADSPLSASTAITPPASAPPSAPVTRATPNVERSEDSGANPGVEVPPVDKVPDFQEWLRQRQEALRKAREAAKKQSAETTTPKPGAAVPSPDEDENRHEPVLTVPGVTHGAADKSAAAPQTDTPTSLTDKETAAASSKDEEAASVAAGVGFNPNRTGRRGAVFNIPSSSGEQPGEQARGASGAQGSDGGRVQPTLDPLSRPTAVAPGRATASAGATNQSVNQPGSQSNQAFVLNEENLGSAEAVEKVLASTELAETPALKALKKFLEQGKPAPIVVEKPKPLKKIHNALKPKALLNLLGKSLIPPLIGTLSSAILLGGWTLVVVGFVVFFLSLSPIPFTDASGAVFWRFQANYASHWAALPRYYNAGVVIPWFLVSVLSAAAFVWITTGLALVLRVRKPLSAYLARMLDRRWYQLKNVFRKPTTAEDALLKTSLNDIESMLAQARKEAEDAVKKRKVAAAGGTPGGSQTNSISLGGAESSAMAQAAASRGSGGNG